MLILPFILLGAILAHRGRSKAWQRIVAPRLRQQLVHQASTTRRWISIALGLLAAAFIIVVIARPYVGETTTNEQIKTRNILIAIDTSRSMLVRDGSPDRMATAQATAIEILETFPNDRVGVIAFSGASVLMVPLTIDHGAVHETISQLDTNVIPTGGSNLSAAVQLALKTFEKTGQKSNALILISDGENHSREIDRAAEGIRETGTTVSAISVGSEAGGIIPDYRQPDSKFRDSLGQTVLSRMIPDALDTLSRAGHGTFSHASSSSSDAIRSSLSSVKKHHQMGRKRTIPNEQYHWFMLTAIVLLVSSMTVRSQLLTQKRPTSPGVKTILTLTLLTSLCQIDAAALDRAEQAYQRKDYSSALTLFQVALRQASEQDSHGIYFAMGTSAYRLKLWDKSTTYFSSALCSNNPELQENAHYNLGKSLFRSGLNTLQPQQAHQAAFLTIAKSLLEVSSDEEKTPVTKETLNQVITQWEDSIAHYQATLDLNPENKRATSNQKNVKTLLDLLKQGNQSEQDPEKNPDDQGHHPETDPNNDPENNDGKTPKDPGDDQGEDQDGGQGEDPQDPKKDPNDKGDPDNNNQGENSDENSDNKQQNQEDPQQEKPKPNMDRKEGESEEAYAARILKENSDAETRPVKRQRIILKRPTKDW